MTRQARPRLLLVLPLLLIVLEAAAAVLGLFGWRGSGQNVAVGAAASADRKTAQIGQTPVPRHLQDVTLWLGPLW